VATSGIWLVIIVMYPYVRWVGFGWMSLGIVVYCIFRRRRRLPLWQTSSKIAPPLLTNDKKLS